MDDPLSMNLLCKIEWHSNIDSFKQKLSAMITRVLIVKKNNSLDIVYLQDGGNLQSLQKMTVF